MTPRHSGELCSDPEFSRVEGIYGRPALPASKAAVTASSIAARLWTPDDIYDSISAAVVERFREDVRVERKSSKAEAKDVAEYLSVFANTQPSGGVVFIGVENDGRISGCKSISHERVQSYYKIGNYCDDARYEIKKSPVQNSSGEGDYILCIRVFYRSDKLVEMNGSTVNRRENGTPDRLAIGALAHFR